MANLSTIEELDAQLQADSAMRLEFLGLLITLLREHGHEIRPVSRLRNIKLVKRTSPTMADDEPIDGPRYP